MSEETKNVTTVRKEYQNVAQELIKGDNWMRERKEPFCSACLKSDIELQKKNTEQPVNVPSYELFSGKDKFVYLGKDPYKDKKTGRLVSEIVKYKCNRGHNVAIETEIPEQPTMVVMQNKK